MNAPSLNFIQLSVDQEWYVKRRALNPSASHLLLLLIDICDYRLSFDPKSKESLESLSGMRREALSRAVDQLVESEFIAKDGYVYHLNPLAAWNRSNCGDDRIIKRNMHKHFKILSDRTKVQVRNKHHKKHKRKDDSDLDETPF